jgi:hypothetical protein
MTCIGGVVYNCQLPPLPPPINYPPRPQQPPQTPPPNPPPPRASVEKRYFLSFPIFVGVNVKVFSSITNRYILPSPEPIALHWQYYPQHDALPEIFASTRNPLLATNLRPHEDEFGRLYVFPDLGVPYPPYPLLVAQFLFHKGRWIVVFHEVYFPRMPDPEWATPQDYRLAIENRTEKLVFFYDSAIHELGVVYDSPVAISLTPEAALVGGTLPPAYNIQPTKSPAYCMFIQQLSCGEEVWVS